MSARAPRFEIVRTELGWHARFRASNGKVIWWTEVYERRRDARNAVALIGRPSAVVGGIRDVDERGQS